MVFYTQNPKHLNIDLGRRRLCVDLDVEVRESEARLQYGVTTLAVAWWTLLAVARRILLAVAGQALLAVAGRTLTAVAGLTLTAIAGLALLTLAG